jgi:hypothetical protein
MPVLEDHLRRFVGPESDAPLLRSATAERLYTRNFWVIWTAAGRRSRVCSFTIYATSLPAKLVLDVSLTEDQYVRLGPRTPV